MVIPVCDLGRYPLFSAPYRFIVWAPRGYDTSQSLLGPIPYGVQRSAEDLRSWLDDLRIETVYVTWVAIPGAVLTLIPGTGHLSKLDQPEACQNQILHFLRGIAVDSGV